MLRRIYALLILLIASAVLAAPVPKNSWEQNGWERPIDPDHDCKLDIKDGAITIELPGGDHDLSPKRKRFNAPRLLRDVEGDFVVQVRVHASFRPSVKSSVKGEAPRVAAGLVLIPIDKNYIRLDYEGYRLMADRVLKSERPQKEKPQRKGDLHRGPAFKMLGEKLTNTEEVELGPPWKIDPNAKEEQIYLLFERQGRDFREAISLDGKEWKTHIRFEGGFIDLPPKMRVGLAAYSTSTEPFKVRFDRFKLTQGGKESK